MAMLLTISLLICAAAALSDAKLEEVKKEGETYTCPPGWAVYGSGCYKFEPEKTTWSEAERSCVVQGGSLASVHSSGEYNFIQDLIRKRTGTKTSSWIGGYDAAQEGIWLWSDGTIFSYTNWHTGEPNNVGGNEHCVLTDHGDEKNWNDQSCSDKFPSVCSRRL